MCRDPSALVDAGSMDSMGPTQIEQNSKMMLPIINNEPRMVPEEPRGRGLGPSSPLRPCAFGVLGADGPGNRGLSCDPIHKALRPGNGRLTFVQRTHRSLPISPPPPHPPRAHANQKPTRSGSLALSGHLVVNLPEADQETTTYQKPTRNLPRTLKTT